MGYVDARHRIVGQERHDRTGRDGFEGAAQAQGRRRAAVAARVNQDALGVLKLQPHAGSVPVAAPACKP